MSGSSSGRRMASPPRTTTFESTKVVGASIAFRGKGVAVISGRELGNVGVEVSMAYATGALGGRFGTD